MELNVFAGQEKSELSMIEVARAILEERGRGNEIYFNDLVNEIQNYLEKSNSEIRAALPIFYSDLNVDGSFIPLGDNKWGLRSWYAIDEIDEEVITLEEDDDAPKRKKKRVNAFMDGDDDIIDYGNDDPEDEEGYEDTDESGYGDENPDDEKDEVDSYDSEINEIIPEDVLVDEDVDLAEVEDDDDYSDDENLDGLNFLAGKRVDEVNKMAELGTQLAHVDGGVPNIKITLPAVNAYYIGQLFYFFEKACGISGYMLGVNPFDQPGVEAYKKNMFALLNKPGYEKESEAIKAKL